MARNVFPKKKRITHMESTTGKTFEENKSLSSGCIDYVSSIIQDMDSDFKLMQGNKSKLQKSFVPEQFLLPESSVKDSNISSVQDSKPTMTKLRNISLVRKFPLMEKSQRILKHIKHNRRIPKPRAHLSSQPMSPIKQPIINRSKILRGKSKNFQNRGRSNYNMNSVSNNTQKSIKPQEQTAKKEKKIEQERIVESNEKSKFSNKPNGYSAANVLNNVETKMSESFKGNEETTDSEYERFVENIKSELPEKIPSKRKKVKKKKIPKKLKKTEIESYKTDDSSESDYDNKNMNKNKKIKSAKSDDMPLLGNKKYKTKAKYLSSTEEEIADYSFEVSNPTESDSMDSISDENSCIASKHHEQKSTEQTTVLLSNKDVCSNSDPNTVVLNHMSDNIQTLVGETNNQNSNKDVCLNSDPNTVVLNDMSDNIQTLVGKTNNQNSFNSNLAVSMHFDSISDSINNKKDSETTTNLPIIDLCSDSEPEDFEPMQPTLGEKKPNFEMNKESNIAYNINTVDSDLEIIEEIPANTTNIKTDKMVANNLQQSFCSNSSNLDISSKASCENHLYTTKVNTIYKTQPDDIEIKKEKHDAAYMTGICKDFGDKKVPDTSDFKHMPYLDPSILKGASPSNMYNTEIKCDKSLNICTDEVLVSNEDLKIKKETCEKKLNRPREAPFTAGSTNLPHEPKISKSFNKTFVVDDDDDDIIIISEAEPSDKNVFDLSSLNASTCKSNHNILKSEATLQNIPEKLKVDQINSNVQIKTESSSNFSPFINEQIDQHHNVTSTTLSSKEFIKQELDTLSNIYRADMFNNPQVSHIVQDFKMKVTKLDECKDINRKDVSHLVELYKKEFKRYLNILKTEHKVETELKLMEAYQADKLSDIRSVIQQYLKDDSSCTKNYDFDLKGQESVDCDTTSSNSFEKLPSHSSEKQFEDNLGKACVSNSSTKLPVIVKSEKLEYSSSHGVKADATSTHGLESEKKQTLKLLGKCCNVCGKKALAACQSCATAFFCSDICGKIYWNQGHGKKCG